MPLIEFWKNSPSAVAKLRIEQIVATAGDGTLSDASLCSQEIRDYFSQIDSDRLALYADQCMSAKFDRSGYVLQDIVNELGRRLDYSVTNGRYQGVSNAIGSDGLWRSPEQNYLVAEVKTSDAYRVSLDRIADYSKKLIQQGAVDQRPSVIIIVGRQDTGELEAQIRGSRHAWEMRLLSVEALCKLVKLKESSDDTESGRKIRSILLPVEYTRLDGLVDVMFTTAKETAPDVLDVSSEHGTSAFDHTHPADSLIDLKVAGQWQFTDTASLQDMRERILATVSRQMQKPLIRKSRALYWDASHDKRLACTLSKAYDKRAGSRYWYAFHPEWREFLSEGLESYLSLGCMDLATAFLIPFNVINELLPTLNTTTNDDRTYWHIHVGQSGSGYEIVTAKGGKPFALKTYTIELGRQGKEMS